MFRLYDLGFWLWGLACRIMGLGPMKWVSGNLREPGTTVDYGLFRARGTTWRVKRT